MELESVTHSEHQSYRMPLTGPVELYGERPAVVWVPDAYGQMVPMPKDQVHAMQPMPARDLTPAPLIDPRAQIIVASGAFAAAAGWGINQALTPLAGFGAGGMMWLAIAVATWKLAPAVGRGKTSITNHTTVHNTNRWFGRSNTTTHQG